MRKSSKGIIDLKKAKNGNQKYTCIIIKLYKTN